MAPIDLKQFADHSQKIPSKYLNHFHKDSFTRKILLSHLIDFAAIFMIAWSMKFFMEATFGSFMLGKSLKTIWAQTPTETTFPFFFAVTTATYFYCSYFLNHGQTWGMHKMNLRSSMEEFSFKDAGIWTLFSMSVYVTGSLFIYRGLDWVNAQGAGKISHHDFLYQTFVMIKDEKAPSLVDLTQEEALEDYSEYKIAA